MSTTPRSASRRRPLAVSLAVLAGTMGLAAALVAIVRAPGPAHRPGQPASAGTSARVAPAGGEDELGRLQDEVRLLRRQVQVMAEQGRSERGEGPAPAAEPPPAPPPLSPAEVQLRDQKHFEILDRKLGSEPIDQGWASSTERLIAQTVKGPAFKGSTLVGTTCRSTLCRFEVSHQSPEDQRRFGNTLPTRLPALPSGSMRRGGSPRAPITVVYAAREGHQLPRDGQE